MIIAVDEAIPYWQQAFSTLGEIRTFSGRKVQPRDVKEADALVVRSVTRVDKALLEGSSVRFVGTATIGTDHLDESYLQGRRIHFTNAAGSNANSVAEYVAAALLVVAQRRNWDLTKKTIAVVGVGHVGSRVLEKVCALGMRPLLCDPPLREATGDHRYQFLEDVLGADILTFHVPLTTTGSYPTHHMVSRALLDRLAPGQYLINTARGAVFDCSALRTKLEQRKIEGAVLDVWEGEPQIDYPLLDFVDIGSPHIAGYSLDGKVRGTEMIAQEFCRIFKIPFKWDTESVYPKPLRLRSAPGSRGQDALRTLVAQAYDILRDDANLRALKSLSGENAKSGFDRLRNEYPLRPEFRHYMVETAEPDGESIARLKGLGFQVAAPDRETKAN
jgi:erythronate-4-phosphate dehydrogenase